MSQASVKMELTLFVWLDDNPPEGLPSGVVGQKVYAKKNDLVHCYHYCYCFNDGTMVSRPLSVPASTDINISAVYGKTGGSELPPCIFACMINESKTGEISHFFMKDLFQKNIPLAETHKPHRHNFTVSDLNKNPLNIHAGLSTPGEYRITLFASYDGVIIPCDPEVDDERDN